MTGWVTSHPEAGHLFGCFGGLNKGLSAFQNLMFSLPISEKSPLNILKI